MMKRGKLYSARTVEKSFHTCELKVIEQISVIILNVTKLGFVASCRSNVHLLFGQVAAS